MTWWFTPLVLVCFWYRYLPRHHWGTWWQIGLILIASFAALKFYREAKIIFPANLSWGKADSLTLSILILINIALIGIMQSPFEDLHFRNANLNQKDISTKPDNWSYRAPAVEVKGIELFRTDLRFIQANTSFLVRGDFRYSDLTGADLMNANLREAKLTNSKLKNAKLDNANLSYAILIHADLEKASLNDANLRDTELNRANLAETYFDNANLRYTNLNSANLKRANFKNSIKLTCPQLQSAYIDKETIMPDYLVISGGQMSKATFWNYEIEVLTDYQCEKIKPLKTK